MSDSNIAFVASDDPEAQDAQEALAALTARYGNVDPASARTAAATLMRTTFRQMLWSA